MCSTYAKVQFQEFAYVCKAIWKHMQAMYLPCPTEEFSKEKTAEFYAKWKFPNCITAVDGKHVWIRELI